MARIKQRYLDELEHEFNTTGQVTLRVRPIEKIFNWVVMPLVWLGSVAVLWLSYVEETWKDPRAWLLLACFVALAIMVPVAAVRMIVLRLRPRPQDKLATRDWVITREGLYPPDFSRISEEIPPLFYSWDGILHIDAQQFPNRYLIPYTAIIAPDVHTVERFRTERPHIKGKLPYYYLNGNIRPAHITWRHTRDARTLAKFLNRCRAQYSSNTRR
ncbi:hypothetical protein QP868_04955 [Brevibacterium sp. UMB1308A]|uniref:hypothetical protein n=1 Tax=Brevibacterium sp. UMB1308A TaxID=3050608 RepID=UPI00254AFDA2|nr:hypothetical protein [Brevibacterium sp. UMB1308A]MDK8713243.1 hypothetical protein [Brevibacterium sp. UMB1308A]